MDKDRVKSRLSVHQVALRRRNSISLELFLLLHNAYWIQSELTQFFPSNQDIFLVYFFRINGNFRTNPLLTLLPQPYSSLRVFAILPPLPLAFPSFVLNFYFNHPFDDFSRGPRTPPRTLQHSFATNSTTFLPTLSCGTMEVVISWYTHGYCVWSHAGTFYN